MALAELTPSFDLDAERTYQRRDRSPGRRLVTKRVDWHARRPVRRDPQIVWVGTSGEASVIEFPHSELVDERLEAVKVLRRGLLWSAVLGVSGLLMLFVSVQIGIAVLVGVSFALLSLGALVLVAAIYSHGTLAQEAIVGPRHASLAALLLFGMLIVSIISAIESVLS